MFSPSAWHYALGSHDDDDDMIQAASIMQDLASPVSVPCPAGMDPLEIDSTVPVVQSLVLLDAEGKRIAVKYFDENK